MSRQSFIRSGALMGFNALVEQLGGSAEALLRKVSLQPGDLLDADHMIPFDAMVLLLEYAAEQLECPEFGLRLSAQQDLSVLGGLGLLMARSATGRDALRAGQRYMAVHSHAEYWTYREFGSHTHIQRYQYSAGIPHARQYKELSFGVCYRLIQGLVGNHFRGLRVEFSHSPISDPQRYRQFFAMDVVFNQEQDQLVLDSRYLQAPLDSFDEQIRLETEQYLAQLVARHANDIERQVKTLVLQTMGAQMHGIDRIARMLNLHKRTLQRKLRERNLTFTQVLNEVRISTACWYLEASNMDVTTLSEMLGYSDISAFSRAFKQQRDCSPLRWRNRFSKAR